MGRRIITSALQSGSTAPKVDTYFDRVLKYIPADINAAWVTAVGLINSAEGEPKPLLLWVAFAVGVLLTALWTWRQTSEPHKPPAFVQIAVATGAFVVWVIALGGPFATIDGFNYALVGSLLLIAYTLGVGIIIPAT